MTNILTWNPTKWNWDDYADDVALSKMGEVLEARWSTGNTKSIPIGSRLYLFRQQSDHGIVGSAVATSEVYQDSHWNGSGDLANFIECEFDVLLPTEERLSVETLLAEIPSFPWKNLAASGMSIPDHLSPELDALWDSHLQQLNEPTPRTRNPSWQRDELILALDLYFRFPPKTISQSHPEVIELSNILNSLPIHPTRSSFDKFRNPNGVYMKLGNFLRFDPEHPGVGLSRGGKLEEEIWNEFVDDRLGLRKLAENIKNGYREVPNDVVLDDEDEADFPEGRVLYRLHRKRERRQDLVKKKKTQAKSLKCEACGFDFFEVYGPVGEGFIECHHTIPLSEYDGNQTTKLSDLALVCSNCHRILHRRRPWLSISELKGLLS